MRIKIFSDTKVNTGRQPELDWLKAACVLGMIVNHILEDLSKETEDADKTEFNATDYISYFFNEVLACVIGATPFTFSMGVTMSYSRYQGSLANLIRGLVLLTIAQRLYLFRTVIPNMIAYWINHEQWFIAQTLLVLQSDILSFIGIALLFMALLRRLKVTPLWMAVIGVVLNIIGHITYYFVITPEKFEERPKNYLVSQFLGYFVLTNAESYFPLFCNFITLSSGYWLGTYYPYIEDKDTLSTIILLTCLPIVIIYNCIRKYVNIPYLPEFSSDERYNMIPLPDAISEILMTFVLISLLYKISKLFNNKIPKIIHHFSANVTIYYIVSYLFILPIQTIIMATQGYLLESYTAGIIGLGIILLTMFVTELYVSEIRPLLNKLPDRMDYIFVWGFTIAVVIYSYPKIENFSNIWNNYLIPDE